MKRHTWCSRSAARCLRSTALVASARAEAAQADRMKRCACSSAVLARASGSLFSSRLSQKPKSSLQRSGAPSVGGGSATMRNMEATGLLSLECGVRPSAISMAVMPSDQTSVLKVCPSVAAMSSGDIHAGVPITVLCCWSPQQATPKSASLT